GPYLDATFDTERVEAICPEGVRFNDALVAARAARMRYLSADRSTRQHQRLATFADTNVASDLSAKIFQTPRTIAKAARGAVASGRPAGGGRSVVAVPPIGDLAAFVKPGIAFTKRAEPRGTVLLLPGMRDRVIRPDVTHASIRLLARQGFDVVIPANFACPGSIGEALGYGNLVRSGRLSIQTAIAKAKSMLDRERPEGEPSRGIDALLTTGPVDAAAMRRALHPRPPHARLPPYDLEARHLVAGAQDVVSFLADRDFGAPKRWSAMRIGVAETVPTRLDVGRLDGQLGGLDGASEKAASAAGHPLTPAATALRRLLSDAGFTARAVTGDASWLATSGLQAWLAPDAVARLRARFARSLDATEIDVFAVSEVGSLALLGEELSVPIIHIVELLDWSYGGPIPPGLEALAPFIVDVPEPEPADREPSDEYTGTTATA
ncbi:MAG: hypothetical protein AAFY64_11285, partial [Pseudomonadota bacterium]